MAFKRPRQKIVLDEDALYSYAVSALARRMRTVAELKRLMRSRVEEEPTGAAKIEAVVLRLKEQKYLSDTRYAADYTRMRQENEKFGRRRVQQDLIHKGIHSDLIAKTLDAAYEQVDEPNLARRFLERKRIQPPADDKSAARVMRMMMRAGFSTSTIFKVLKQWKVSEDTLSLLETAEPDAGDDPGTGD